MASTNKTTHYELSQYIGTDKPTYLGDYNTDMSNIDTGIYNAQADATSALQASASAVESANSAIGAVGTLSNLTTSEKSNLVGAINEVDAHEKTDANNIGTLSNLTTAEKSNLVGAINEVNNTTNANNVSIGNLSNLATETKTNLVSAINEVQNTTNLSNFVSFDKNSQDIVVSGGTFNSGLIHVATNSDKSVFKIYCNIVLLNTTSTNPTITLPAGTFKTTDSSYNIEPTGFAIGEASNTVTHSYLTINPNGSGVIHIGYIPSNSTLYLYMFPCLYFAKDFGD